VSIRRKKGGCGEKKKGELLQITAVRPARTAPLTEDVEKELKGRRKYLAGGSA